jgi:hypothetical protein
MTFQHNSFMRNLVLRKLLLKTTYSINRPQIDWKQSVLLKKAYRVFKGSIVQDFFRLIMSKNKLLKGTQLLGLIMEQHMLSSSYSLPSLSLLPALCRYHCYVNLKEYTYICVQCELRKNIKYELFERKLNRICNNETILRYRLNY